MTFLLHNSHNPAPQGTTQAVREENQRTQDHRLNESRTLSQYHSDAAHPLGSVVGAFERALNKAKEEDLLIIDSSAATNNEPLDLLDLTPK